ncbi:ATP-binding protein [Zhenpiania hominis]|uniref:ATP-binding protein n=1 Tax=Zhenpiania hominis TaxID=2763644 RepID=UPI0039F53CFD
MKREARGELKIFFGYAAGAGKTYAMLEEARAVAKSGVDVVVGVIDPHTRPETMALLEGMEVLPPLKAEGAASGEFDLDAALKRKPELILVDELAHTNARGLRHTKRYSDIEELLNAGIHVFTTVNVQHVESLNDLVASITQVIVEERVPDSIFDRAEQLELVDIEPEELLQRLKDGNVYKAGQAERELAPFFTPDNLVALREISLRYTADQVNQELETIKNSRTGGSRYQLNEHILVCVGPSPSSKKVIRTAARMASAFHGRFTALYVETPDFETFSDEMKKQIHENLHLAEILGAKLTTTYSDDIPYQIVEFARVSGISKIVIGRQKQAKGLKRFFSGNAGFIDRILSLAPDLEVFVIPDEEPDLRREGLLSWRGRKLSFSMKDFCKTVLIMAAAAAAGLLFQYMGMRDANAVTILILGVLVTANQTNGRIYGVMASLAGVLLFNFFFISPRFTLYANAEYAVTFLVMLAAALITSTLTSRAHSQASASALNVYRTDILLDAGSRLQHAESLDEIVIESERQIYKIMKKPVLFYTVEKGEIANIYSYDSQQERPVNELYMTGEEQAVVKWVIRNKKKAGKRTDTLPGAKAYYIPVKDGHNEVLAVVGLVLDDSVPLEDMERSLLSALLGQIAFALENYYSERKKRETEVEAERERFRANLLRSISHDLRTPLTSISGSASSLLSTDFAPETRKKLTQGIYEDSIWLIELVENLLAISRFDGDKIEARKEPQLLEEVIEEAMNHMTRKSIEHIVSSEVEDPLLMAEVDVTLIVQVLVNLINNAVEYTPKGSKIQIRAFSENGQAVVQVADDGNGVPDSEKEAVFQMFYTGGSREKSDSRRGMGLGLALCKSIVEAHGGRICIKDNVPRGAIFEFTLPLAEVKNYENFNSNR